MRKCCGRWLSSGQSVMPSPATAIWPHVRAHMPTSLVLLSLMVWRILTALMMQMLIQTCAAMPCSCLSNGFTPNKCNKGQGSGSCMVYKYAGYHVLWLSSWVICNNVRRKPGFCICLRSLNTLITQHSHVHLQRLSTVAQSYIAAKNGQPED